MVHRRRVVGVALAAAFCLAPAADARERDGHEGRASLVPVRHVGGVSAGELLGENWASVYVQPPGPGAPCTTLAGGRVLPLGPAGGTLACTATTRTRLLVLGMSSACSDAEPPPFYAVGEAAQQACALAVDETFTAILVTVDGGPAVDIRNPRFEVFSPQMTVDLPAENIFGLPPGTTTLAAHAWMALVRRLPPGRHIITIERFIGDQSVDVTTHDITLVRARPHDDDEDDGDDDDGDDGDS
jgi:hypothetical protein